MQAIASLLVLGFVLGLRHATDADHVVAVGAITSRERSLRSALWIGASWGLGHALTVLVVGGAIVLFGLVIPPRVGLGMEFSVALMLIALGVVNLRGALRHLHETAHADRSKPAPASVPPGALRAVGVGIVHGLAGSAAVALLVLASITDPKFALVYLAVFGIGTILGMMTLTSALALPVAFAGDRFERMHRGLARAAGVLSVAVGLFLAYRIGFVDGLFGVR
jgi:high-affinity nickel-transport protein